MRPEPLETTDRQYCSQQYLPTTSKLVTDKEMVKNKKYRKVEYAAPCMCLSPL